MAYGRAPARMSTRSGWTMSDVDKAKQERLAAALRENLRRRKAQARAADSPPASAEPKEEP